MPVHRFILGAAALATVGFGTACRASCNFDLNQPTCDARFTGTRLVVHSTSDAPGDRDAVTDATVAVRGDAELGTGWAFTRVADDLVLGFPEAGAAGRLPLFRAIGTCAATTTRILGYVADATLARQPRLRVRVGDCADDEEVLFTGPADFGARVLPWERDDAGWDLWVAAPGEGLSRGAVWLFDGADARATDQRSHDTAAVQLEGMAPGDRLGTVLARCGDLDGDGADELAIGAPGWSREGTPELGGAVWIVSPTRLAGGQLGEAAAGSILWGPTNAAAGTAVHCTSDLDGDGVLDVIIGAPTAEADQRGAVYVVSASSLPYTGALDDIASMVLGGDEPGGRTGTALTVADLSGDALPDLVVGVPGSAAGGAGAGAVAVYPGAELRSGLTAPVLFTGRIGLSVDGHRSPPRLGTSVAAADLDQDGSPELLGAAWRSDRDSRSLHAGEVVVWPGTLVREVEGAAHPEASVIAGEGPHQEVGHLLVIEDVDDDGVPDVVTAARRQAR